MPKDGFFSLKMLQYSFDPKMGVEIQLKKLAFSRLKIRVVLRCQLVCFVVSHHPCG